mmetsp:Transcript_24397/g.31855  ORF Transcript_24397/g.31855 Transcript_24397/m.31855 type:complete len:300 (+) Transcript_24397:428-1327(+)|eukprot:CAMPEP_0117768590 /NCGR_PEP_ID=MMETSP0947-20121206/22481_1 /TAXON_ID=44440 /ORGANISM="Chattonella subsalsa, Strain CCMP2191" /LENGTH=299 /DNA_ID=CAMNT_0005592831 /DNA_START=75 /DNA_END=974 /DNA_ORIENTATION=+
MVLLSFVGVGMRIQKCDGILIHSLNSIGPFANDKRSMSRSHSTKAGRHFVPVQHPYRSVPSAICSGLAFICSKTNWQIAQHMHKKGSLPLDQGSANLLADLKNPYLKDYNFDIMDFLEGSQFACKFILEGIFSEEHINHILRNEINPAPASSYLLNFYDNFTTLMHPQIRSFAKTFIDAKCFFIKQGQMKVTKNEVQRISTFHLSREQQLDSRSSYSTYEENFQPKSPLVVTDVFNEVQFPDDPESSQIRDPENDLVTLPAHFRYGSWISNNEEMQWKVMDFTIGELELPQYFFLNHDQ